MVLYGDQFLVFCARVRSEGKYIRRVDVVGNGGWRVRESDVLPASSERGSGSRGRTPRSMLRAPCSPEVAQLWFDILRVA